jgi:hypothetical protein
MQAERLPPRLGWVSLDVNDAMGEITGIFKNTCRMAERAVELLMNERLRRETGLPKEPLTLMIEGMWIAGKTLYAV